MVRAPGRPRHRALLMAGLLCAASPGLAAESTGSPASSTSGGATVVDEVRRPGGVPSPEARAYRIEGGSLGAVLSRFAAAAGVALSFDPAVTTGRRSDGLDGPYTVREGFETLLAGSGLEAVEDRPGEYSLRGRAPGTAPDQAGASMASVIVVARAAPVPTDADDRYQPTPDASTLRTMASPLELPAAVNVVPAQVMRDQRPQNIDNALANVSGITQGNTLASTQDTVLKRGFGGNRDGSIMHNGMPLVQGRGLNAAAESVEVLKGPASLLYGIMDPGGIINVVSKKPQLRQRTSISLGRSGYAGGRLGGQATVDTSGPIGEHGLAYRLVADHVDEDYWRNFGTRRETLFAPSLAWYGDDTQAIFWYEYRRFVTPFDRGTVLDPRSGRPLDVPRTRRLDEPINAMSGEAHLAQLSVDHKLRGGWAVHLNLSYNREVYDANQLRNTAINTTLGTLTRSNDATHGSVSLDSYGTVYADGKVQLGGMRHDLLIGVDAEYRKFYRADLLRQAVSTPFSYLNPVYGLIPPSSTVSASDSAQTDLLHNQSLVLQDSIHLTDRWIAVAGARYQLWRQTAGRGRPFVTNTETDGSKWLPRLGLVYRLNDAISFYGSYSQSLKPTSTIAPLASGMVITSSVAPEEAKSWEIGAKLSTRGGLTGTLALFDIRKRNVLVSQYNEATRLTDWRTAGAARSRGLELDLAGQVSRDWSLIASYAYLDAKTTDDPLFAGNELWNVARHTASFSAVYDAGQVFGDLGRLRLGGGAQYVGRRSGDSAKSFWLPGYTVAHAFATLDTRVSGRRLRFQLNVKNLFDKAYYPSSVNNYGVAVGEARQIALTSTLEF